MAAPLALAQGFDAEEQDARMCRNGLPASDPPFQLARIAGDGRAYLLEDTDKCPEEGECRQESYLVPGDQVVVTKLRMGHACVHYPNASGNAAGYVPLDRIALQEHDTDPPPEAWLGTWSDSGNPHVAIAMEGGGLTIAGTSYWPGPNGSRRYPYPNIGDIDGPLTILGNRARYDDGHCRVDFTLVGQFLMAHDNFRCGGLNVRFDGLYRRDTAK